MAEFKPMVKMMTTEPTVELKLKKGGHVAKKAFGGMIPAPISVTGKLSARGGAMDGKSPKKPSLMERRKAMSGALLNSKKGGTAKHEDAAQDRAMIKKALAGKKFASGGEIDKFETKTTIEGNAGKFAKTKVDTAKKDKAHGTGEVKEGKPAGYKRGGHATGGAIPADTDERMNKGKSKFGGTIEGNERDFDKTEMHSAKKDTAHGTGGVRMANAGGFKHGGKIMHKASGGSVDWENLPARGTPPGKTNTTTGGVKESNAGGYKKGGAAKKHFATGGAVNDAGHPVAMPRKPVSKPVANTMQSGTFKKGGKVEKEEKSNLRLVKTHTGPQGHVAKVYKDRDWGEHRVKFFNPEGKHLSESDYHTDDVSDANDTAMSQVSKGYKHGGKVVHKAYGGGMPMADDGYDPIIAKEAARRAAEQEAIRRDNEATPVMDSVKKMLGINRNAGAGRGFVNPPMVRKAGGRAKR